MREKDWEIAGGSLHYEINGEYAEVTGFNGLASEVTVPESIEGCPVRTIGKKAFLSRKNVRRIRLPQTVEEVGDWAFAYCDSLEEVWLPRREIRFGRSVFMECGRLKRIALQGYDGEAELLAAAVTAFDAYYLLALREAGTKEWLEKWDAKLAAVLHTPDREGYSRQVLCGEEDYGSTDERAYVSGRRKAKVRLALLRLLFPQELSAPLRRELEQYLLDHTKGGESEETWQVILQEHGEDRPYYSLFADLGCINAENLEGILADTGEDYPEMKAFFLRYREEKLGMANFFDSLNL